jgi:hypothetical protein
MARESHSKSGLENRSLSNFGAKVRRFVSAARDKVDANLSPKMKRLC